MIKVFRIVAVLVFIMSSCKSKQQASQNLPIGDNSQNSLDWNGVYRGLLPCADCPGILMELELNTDLTYKLSYQYQEATPEVFTEKGVFEWNDSGSKITLIEDDQSNHRRFQVGENQLFSLDGDGNRITGELAEMYILKKNNYDNKITEKYWKLITLNDKPIAVKDTQSKEAHFILKENENAVNGSTGCNGIRGTYTLEEGDKIHFSQMLSTRMACMDVPYEGEYLKVLEKADHYSLMGDTLTLKAADKTLATFEAVWFH
ncbi:copper resistance protein NlpE N-terminal domain-containing protein [Galbibacter sp.]|jgi:uncharacterized lipoprotein NlpE involved in copper resistance|uniref:copper resistance protein NlpE N-terminal domain-containing protein n=1 Tax=Galbibacter sp. TaxID=2918471 RepID=UPI003A952CAE